MILTLIADNYAALLTLFPCCLVRDSRLLVVVATKSYSSLPGMVISNRGYVLQCHKNDNGVAQDRCECLDFGNDLFTIGS